MTRRVTDTETVRDAVAIELWHANRKFDVAIRALQPAPSPSNPRNEAVIYIGSHLNDTLVEAIERWRVRTAALGKALNDMAKRYEERTRD